MRFNVRIMQFILVLCSACGPTQCQKDASTERADATQPLSSQKVSYGEQAKEGEQTTPPNSQQHSIAFLGDSLTAGYGLEASQAFPAKVQQMFADKGMDWKVTNAGISGDTTAGALARTDWLLKSKPAVVFVCLGGNDGLRRISTKVTFENLDSILTKLKASGAKVFLVAMRVPDNYGKEYAQSFSEIFPQLSQKHNVPLMPSFIEKIVLNPEYSLPDGIHPNDKGTTVIAQEVFNFLQDKLEAKTP